MNRPESLEIPHRAHELVRDEDVLSVELQAALESVGTAVGVLAALALVAAHVGRGRRAVRAIRAPDDARSGRST